MSLDVIASPIQEHPQRLRPDAHRHRRAVGDHRRPPGARCRAALEQYVESLHRRRGPGQRQPAPPGRGVHRPVRGVHRRRRLLRHARSRAPGPTTRTAPPTSRRGSAPSRSRRVGAYADLGRTLRPRDPPAGAGVRRLRPRALPAASRAPSSAPPSTSRRPTPGARRSWPGSPPRWRPWPTQIKPGAHGQGGDRPCSTPTRPTSCTAPTSCRAWMQEQGRRGHRRAWPASHFDIPEPVRTHRVPDRADPRRRHLLHRPERGLHPPGPDVVVGAQGRRPSSPPGAS